ncbi:MAG: hypothetical protein ACT4O2_10705 [Beijerinckiaceae bacterium]
MQHMVRFDPARRKKASSIPSKDQALLDSLVEASLAEERADRPMALKSNEAGVDPAQNFLASAVAFLAGRPDRDELIERLRESVAAAPPQEPPAEVPAGQPPEAGDVRKDG